MAEMTIDDVINIGDGQEIVNFFLKNPDWLKNVNAEDTQRITDFFLKNHHYLKQANDDGELPIHIAVKTDNIGLVKLFIEAGADLNQRNQKGESALRLANKLKHNEIAKYLVVKSPDLSSGFEFATDLKTDLPTFMLIYIGFWFVTCFLFILGMICAFIAVFTATFLTGLWISAIIAAVVGLVIAIYVVLKDLQYNYVIAPGYLGKQQVKLISAIDPYDSTTVNNIISENSAWLFVPINLFGDTVLDKLMKNTNREDIFTKLLPKIIDNPHAIKNLLSSKKLAKYPEFLRKLVNELPIDMIRQYQGQLLNLFLENIDFFKAHAAESTLMFAKMTVIRPLLEDFTYIYKHNGEFITAALKADSSPWATLANGYIALGGLFGEKQDIEKAADLFITITPQNKEVYFLAQSELGANLHAQCADEPSGSLNWIKRYFASLTHLMNACSLDVSQSKVLSKRQENDKEFLELLKDDSDQIFTYLVERNALNLKGEMDETLILMAAKLGHWDMVEKIAQAYTASTVDNRQYHRALCLAIQAGKSDIACLLIQKGALQENYVVPATGDSFLHLAVAQNNKPLLEELLKLVENTEILYTRKNKDGLSPFAYAAQHKPELAVFMAKKYPYKPHSLFNSSPKNNPDHAITTNPTFPTTQ